MEAQRGYPFPYLPPDSYLPIELWGRLYETLYRVMILLTIFSMKFREKLCT